VVAYYKYPNRNFYYYLDRILPGYGSIFLRSDVEPKMVHTVVDEPFAIGPSMDRSFWSDEREIMDIDRGPWSEPTEYLSALCRREQHWILLHASSQASLSESALSWILL